MGGVRVRAARADRIDDLFADNLHALRMAQRVSRRELGERTGIPYHSIEKMETRHGTTRRLRRRPTIGEAVVLAEALGVKPGELLRGPRR